MRNSATLSDDGHDDPDGSGRMSFLDHLEELRRRVVYSLIGIGVAAAVAMAFAERLFDFVIAPINALLPPGSYFIYTRYAEGFAIRIELVLIAASILAAPWILFQLWLFIAPGLYQREKRFAIPFVVLTTAGCVGGAAFNHYVAFRAMVQFFGEFSTATVRLTPTAESVFDLYIGMAVGMMLVFQMPTVAFFLARMGVVTARVLLQHFKHAVLAAFVIGAVVTASADPWNQTILAGTILALYAVCIAIAAIFGRKPHPGDLATVLVFASAPLWGSNVVPFRKRS
jgi:sec-independent protein translocase protein TatC